MGNEKYIVNIGYSITLKGGIVAPDYIFGIDEVTGNRQQETIDFLLAKKVIKQLESKLKPKSELEPKSEPKSKPLNKRRRRSKARK